MTVAAGFTLMELMVVMALLAIMATLAVPALRTTLSGDPLKATARRLVGLIQQGSLAARAAGRPCSLLIDRRQRRCSLHCAGGGGSQAPGRGFQIPAGVRVSDLVTLHGGASTGDTLVLPFTAQGYVDQSLIHLRDGSGQQLTLTLSPFLAVVRVEEGVVSMDDARTRW